MNVIDLRSDTKTLPTEEMRRAMYEAEVGDDVSREDPTINRLEELAAHMLKKESALFTPSGIMSNLLAVLTHTYPGEEILLGSESHMFWYEVGGASALGGVIMRTVPNNPNGQIDPKILKEAIRLEDIHFPPTTLLCLENTHNRCGGAVLTTEYTSIVTKFAHKHNLKVHLDGARIFSAAVSLNVPVSKLADPADSVCFCLSKNLSAPVGSLLCGTSEFIKKARKKRRMLGGGMRQAGIIAAAGIITLETMIDRLAEDHANAQRLAYGLAKISGIVIEPDRFKTNIVTFEPPISISSDDFIQQMANHGVKLTTLSERTVRAVTHRMVSTDDIEEVLNRVEFIVKKINRH